MKVNKNNIIYETKISKLIKNIRDNVEFEEIMSITKNSENINKNIIKNIKSDIYLKNNYDKDNWTEIERNIIKEHDNNIRINVNMLLKYKDKLVILFSNEPLNVSSLLNDNGIDENFKSYLNLCIGLTSVISSYVQQNGTDLLPIKYEYMQSAHNFEYSSYNARMMLYYKGGLI